MVADIQVPAGYKFTDIGVIPDNWEVMKLKKVSFMKGRIGWQGLKETEFTMNSDEPYLITGMNFKDGKIRWDEVYHVSVKRYEIAKEIQLKVGDILMTKDGTIGKLLYVDEIPYPNKATLNSHLLVFRPLSNSYLPKFLYYQLASKTFKDYVELNKSGSTFFGISQEAVGNYLAILPPLPEQLAIAAALSDVDALIEKLDNLIEKKRNIRQGTMQELLTGKLRVSGFNGEWVEKTLGETSILKARIGWQGLTTAEYLDQGDYYLVTGTDFKNGKINWNNCSYVEKQRYSQDRNIQLKPDDVLVTKDGTIGKVAFVPNLPKPATLNSGVFVIRPKNQEYIPLFFYYLLRSIYFDQFLNQLAAGSTISHLYQKDFVHFKFPLPLLLEEQQAISQILSDMDSEIEQLVAKKDKYVDIKQGMMQQLLTGKVRLA